MYLDVDTVISMLKKQLMICLSGRDNPLPAPKDRKKWSLMTLVGFQMQLSFQNTVLI